MSGVATTQAEVRLQRLLDARELNTQKHESLLAGIESRDDKTLTEVEAEHVTMYREKATELDGEIESLASDIKSARDAIDTAKALRRAIAGAEAGVEVDAEGIIYRDFATFARDVILTRGSTECSKIAQLAGGEDFVLRANERLGLLRRTPANTLSSDVEGLQPAQHIAQIFQVIDASRPLVASAPSTGLVRGQLTYPKVTTRPIVAVQASEKTEAGNQGMVIDMETANASTYLGGGDLSWQTIQWSSPDALALWFQFAAADYALKTEQDAGNVVTDSAFAHKISSTLGATPTFAELMTAIGAGYAAVYANSNRIANTVYMAPDRFGYLLGLTSNAFTQFTNVSGSDIGPLNIVISRGMDAGEIVVGDREGLLVAETPGAPVELRVVEPAIGGVEVGIIGAFEAVVVDDGAFSQITTAS